MATQHPPKRGVTPPKGRPTRSRHQVAQRRAFGSTAQWIAFAILIVVAFIVLVMVTDGGDFNPIGGAPAAPVQPAGVLGIGGDSQPM